MKLHIKIRLSAMMFLQYFVWGAWYVTVGTWLGKGLHFTGQQIGLVAGTTAVGAILAPFLVGLIADKLFATEKVLAVLHVVGSLLLLLASRQTSFTAIYALVLLYCLCFMPTLALTNSLSFRQMSDPKQEFGGIRVLGTLGWIVAGLNIGALKLESTAQPLEIAAACSLAMGCYSFTLPHTPPLATGGALSASSLFPKEALALLKSRSMAGFAISSFLICIPLQFYYAFTNLFLNNKGVQNAAGKMTGGQMSELFCMLLIPWFFRRLGVKYMLAVGMLAWVLRYLLFAYGNAGPGVWMFWIAILFHGICYDFFFVTGQIYIDRKSSLALRAAAQGLITFITYGLGMLLGSWISGAIVDRYTQHLANGSPNYNWHAIWISAALASAAVLIVFLITFSENEDAKRQEVNSPACEVAQRALI
jgi:nucleoside transporter